MKHGKFNMLMDAYWGSSGKGKMTTYLAKKHHIRGLCSTNMPNAGHTTVIEGHKFVAKILPTAAFLNKVHKELLPFVFIGPTAAFTIEQLMKEIKECELTPGQVYIHPRAGVVTAEHKNIEVTDMNGPKTIASTCQGSGAFLSDKIMRRPGIKLARDYPELSDYVIPEGRSMPMIINGMMDRIGITMLHEVSQGFALDINHGSDYPNCTSRSTNSLQAIADMGVHLSRVGDIYLNVHTTPIRVGNLMENGSQVGYSGDVYADSKETTWEEVGRKAGMPEEEIQKLFKDQLTTVTKRLRRVFSFSWIGLERAIKASSTTKICLNFAQFIDWKAYKVRKWEDLPQKVKDFVNEIEIRTNLPVVLIGTGPDNEDIVDRE